VLNINRFGWAVYQLNTLGKCYSRSSLRKVLISLLLRLDQIYDRILCAISKEDTEYAVCILQ
jgi:hypothetical protein